eukprot:5999984-Amphidinium_carterae.1
MCSDMLQRQAVKHIRESDEAIQWFRILATITPAVCRRPPSSTIFIRVREWSWFNHRSREDCHSGQQPQGEHCRELDDEGQSSNDIRQHSPMDFQLLQQYTHWYRIGGVSSYDNESYDNEEYNEEEYDENWDYDNNDPGTIAFMKGKARGQREGKGKGKKGDNKGKESRTVTCYTCGKQGHTSTFCYQNQKERQESVRAMAHKHPTTINSPVRAPKHQYYSQPSTPQYPPSTTPQYPKAYGKGVGKNGTKEPMAKEWGKMEQRARKVIQFQYTKSATVWHRTDDNQQWSGQEVGQVLQQQLSGDNLDTTLPIVRSLYEIDSLKAVGYNGYNNYSGGNDIYLDRQSPRHLKDFWSKIIDTGTAVSVCPMTFCEHIEVGGYLLDSRPGP